MVVEVISIISADELRAQLEAARFTGLYVPGECACELQHLAPCGLMERVPGEPFVNGCRGGYCHPDPRRSSGSSWVVWDKPQPPTDEEWALFDG